MDDFKEYILKSKNFEELYDIRWKLNIGNKVTKKHYQNLKIGLVNVACMGYGDIIKCIKLYEYLRKWYPGSTIQILSSSKYKFRNLGFKEPIIDIKLIVNETDNGFTRSNSECRNFKNLKLSNNKKFDLYFIVPMINDPFNINDFNKLVPSATLWNTFTMSEYNDKSTEPTDLPTGVGKDKLGLFFDKSIFKKQTTIKNPYALVYIQSSGEGILHSRYCFLSFINMIINKTKYREFKTFEVVLPLWICDDILYYYPFKKDILKILKKRYNAAEVITEFKKTELFNNKNSKKTHNKNSKNKSKKIIFRGDILPQPRNKFIGFINGSVKDILLTGDESLVDTLNCCKNKTIWYQIAPWKIYLAESLYIQTGNKNYKTYKTSCGNMKGYKFKNDVDKLIKENDFRIKGKERIDSILFSFYENNNDKEIKKMIEIIENSRYLDTLKNKIKNM